MHELVAGQRLLALRDRLGGLPAGREGAGQPAAGSQRDGVTGAEVAFGVGEQALAGGDGLVGVARRLVGRGQAAPGVQGDGVGRAPGPSRRPRPGTWRWPRRSAPR
jgi:hypothetical protein